jgi:hypothetical protein
MIQFILQDRATGLYLRDIDEWASASRDAQTFSTYREAHRFAHETGRPKSLRAVVRVQRNQHWILMPLLDVHR